MAIATESNSLKKHSDVVKLASKLQLERSSFDDHWRQLNDFILPRRTRFQTTDDDQDKDRRTTKIVDGTATRAARTLQSGLHSGVTSPARPWFRLTTPDPDLAEFGPVKQWLHTVTTRMQTVFLRSNIYNILPVLYGDLGVFGVFAYVGLLLALFLPLRHETSAEGKAAAAGLAMLRYLIAHPEVYTTLEARAAELTAWTPPGVTVNRVGSMFTFFFSSEPVTDWESAKRCDTARFGKFFHSLLERAVYIAPSQFEAGFVSAAHSEEDIRATVKAARAFFQ